MLVNEQAVQPVPTLELTKALSRMAGSRHSDGVSSIVSADDRSVIINECHDMMLALRTLRAAPFLQGVKVKALEWYDMPGISTAPNNNPRYCAVKTHNGKGVFSWSLEIGGIFSAKYDTLETAKAAAQADYSACILPAIEPSPSPRAQALEEAARKAQKAIAAVLMNSGLDHDKWWDGLISAQQSLAAAIRALSSQPAADAALSVKSQRVNSGAFRLLSKDEWSELGGDSNPKCDWHEGIGYVIYDDQAHQEYLKKTNALATRPNGGSDADA